MKLLRPIPRAVSRPVSALILIAWVGCMAVLVHRTYLQASPGNLATDLARYGPTATWRGVYYRGEKIGFTVSQTVRTDTGFELQEDARLELVLLGSTSATALRTTAVVDEHFALQSFAFSLDPGTGAIEVTGEVQEGPADSRDHRLVLTVKSGAGSRTETRELRDLPVLNLNFSRILASRGIEPGTTQTWTMFDPATLRNAPVELRIGDREVVRTRDGFIPAFRVDMAYQGLTTTSWVTDTGDVVREESPLGLMTVSESPEDARGLAVPGRVQQDLLRMSAVVPVMRQRIDEPRDVRRLRLRLQGFDGAGADMDGVGQTVDGDIVDIQDPRTLPPGPADRSNSAYLAPEPLIESDAPEIIAEAQRAVAGVSSPRDRAERLTRYVNALLEKKPTISIPSALEVLRTKIGDCNEHTALYVAMARAAGIPARIAVGLVYMRGAQGAFYYHAWPEVYLDEGNGRGLWLPVDPTLNQFPADGTHLRLVRGGLEQQAAIVPLIGRLRITVLDLELDPQSTPILVGQDRTELPAVAVPAPVPAGACGCDDQ
jgi:transglutaminase-like putative cysteine protease